MNANRLACSSLLVILAMACVAHASDGGSIGLYFDRAGTTQSMSIPDDESGHSQVTLYTIIKGPDGPISEFRLGLTRPEGVFIVGSQIVGIGGASDLCGIGYSLSDLRCIALCNWDVGDPILVAQFTILVFNGSEDLVFEVGPGQNATGPDHPLYVRLCDNRQVFLEQDDSLFGPGRAVINPTQAVGTGSQSWSRIKSLY